MTLLEFRDILLTISNVPVFHNESDKSDEYIVWQEVNGALGFNADGAEAESGMRIAVEFFTKTEYSTVPNKIKKKLEAYDEIYISDIGIDYEADTGYNHYTFDVEVIGNG